MKDYLTISEVAEKWNVTIRWVNELCNAGRIKGATKFGNTWAIPVDAKRPPDQRIKSGKYVKNKKTELEGK